MGNTSWSRSSVALAVSLAVGGQPAEALLFEKVPYGDGRYALLIRDCGTFSSDYGADRTSRCEAWQEMFVGGGTYRTRAGRTYSYAGDPAVLASRLRQEPFAEVWLFSGGGQLQAGVEIGRVLRRSGATVRVPNAARIRAALGRAEPRREVACVSSCTVAFMGGLFRYLDPGATYEVHSASRVMSDVAPQIREQLERGDFPLIAREAQTSSRFRALQLLTHFQNTLLKTTREPQRGEDDERFWRWARTSPPPIPYSDANANADRQRMAAEGMAAAQDIVMRIERDAMRWAIDELRGQLTSLGPRAGPALRMVEAMYDVSIMETAQLTRETMLRMGYLTQEVDLDPRN